MNRFKQNRAAAIETARGYIVALLDSNRVVLIQDGGSADAAIGKVLGNISTLDRDGRPIVTLDVQE